MKKMMVMAIAVLFALMFMSLSPAMCAQAEQTFSVSAARAEAPTPESAIDVSDLKKEIQWLRDEIRSIKEQKVQENKDYEFGGSLELSSGFGNVISYSSDPRGPIGPEGRYRLAAAYTRDMNENSELSLKLDTMDGGFNSSTLRDLVTKIVQIEGTMKADIGIEQPLTIKATFGGGDTVHRDTTGIAPSEDYRVYRRAYPMFSFSTALAGFDISSAYIARNMKDSGEIATSEAMIGIRKHIGTNPYFGEVEWFARASMVFLDPLDPPTGDHDSFAGIGLRFAQSDDRYQEIFLDTGSSASNSSYFNGKAVFERLNDGNTDLSLDLQVMGSSYRKPFISTTFMPLNVFDKYVLNDSVDIGLKVTHKLSSRLLMVFRSDMVMNGSWKSDISTPGTSFTNELGLSYSVEKDILVSGFYRIYNVPSGTGQFGDPMPYVSDLLGLSLTYIF